MSHQSSQRDGGAPVISAVGTTLETILNLLCILALANCMPSHKAQPAAWPVTADLFINRLYSLTASAETPTCLAAVCPCQHQGQLVNLSNRQSWLPECPIRWQDAWPAAAAWPLPPCMVPRWRRRPALGHCAAGKAARASLQLRTRLTTRQTVHPPPVCACKSTPPERHEPCQVQLGPQGGSVSNLSQHRPPASDPTPHWRWIARRAAGRGL